MHTWRNLAALIALAALGCGRADFQVAQDAGEDVVPGDLRQVTCEENDVECTEWCFLGSCHASCESGASCEIRGFGARRLEAVCAEGARCDVETNRVDAVAASCRAAATCELACDRAERCEIKCEAGSACELVCTDGDRCEVACGAAASCLLRCEDDAACALTGCATGATECGGGIRVCGRDCPS